MEISSFNEALEKIFRIELTSETKVYLYYRHQNLEFKLKKKRFRDAVTKLQTLASDQEFEIYDNNTFEVSVSQSGRLFYPGDEEICKQDTVNKLKYTLAEPSDSYLILTINQLHEISQSSDISRNLFYHRLRNRRPSEENTTDLIEVLKQITRFRTLRIEAESRKSKDEYETLAYAFLFNFSYNTDLAFLPSSIIETLTRRIRIGRIRRASIEDIEPPKRRYENDLILFYQKGISAESVDIQYLSFYHILEHFFERIYNDDLIKSVKTELTKPSFSYKRNKDVTSLVKVIQDKLRYKNEEFQINEPEALKLVLDRFIPDFEAVKVQINTYDTELLNYYKKNEVSFSKGNRVNFEEPREATLKNLRERIYKTRNSIVHSKETDKERYLPYKHDKVLQKEIFLMRIMAENIVFESSREL